MTTGHRAIPWRDPDTGNEECRTCGKPIYRYPEGLRHLDDPEPGAEPEVPDPLTVVMGPVTKILAVRVRPLFRVGASNCPPGAEAAAWATAELMAADLAAAGWLAVPTAPVDADQAPVGRDHPDTAKTAAAAVLPRSGSFRREVLRLVVVAGGNGMTDDELEVATGSPHQTVSARRNGLRNDGWIESRNSAADGKPLTRVTRSGHQAIIWFPTTPAVTSFSGRQ